MTAIGGDDEGYRPSGDIPAIGLDHLTVTPGESDVRIESTTAEVSYKQDTGDNYDERL